MKRQWEVSDKVEFSLPEKEIPIRKFVFMSIVLVAKKIKFTIKLFKKYKVVNE